MLTRFSATQLADPEVQEYDRIVRTCVHCGFCLSTCPTYVLLGDELDGPRGRIYLAKEMLEHDRPATAPVVRHLDRCLSCRSCMTTCPSGVDYARLLDGARTHIGATYRRPLAERLMRRAIAAVVPRPALFRAASLFGRAVRPLAGLLGRLRSRALPQPLRVILDSAPRHLAPPSWVDRPQTVAAEGERRLRVALFTGCVQQVLRPQINEATVRLLTRHGCEVVIVRGAGCCGGIDAQLGRDEAAKRAAVRNVRAFSRLLDQPGGLDAIVFTASGCGLELVEYGRRLARDPQWAGPAARIAGLCRDVTQVLQDLGTRLPAVTGERPPAAAGDWPAVAHLLSCTMQHGLGLRTEATDLLQGAGFEVRQPAEPHLCCGAAGAYPLLQPELAGRLRERKLDALRATGAGIIATGNIGCLAFLAAATDQPVLHTAELLDWATGGPMPPELAGAEAGRVAVPSAT